MSSVQNPDSLSEQLAKLTAMNHSMLKNAESGDWEKVIDEEVLRREMLEALYSSIDIQYAPGVASATREMLLINQKLEKLANSAHKSTASEIVSMHRGRQAISTYEKYVR